MEQHKLSAAEETLKQINHDIEQRIIGEFRIDKCMFPWLLTGILNPIFTKKAIDPVNFQADDSCIGCGTCEQVFNCNNIQVSEKPQWGQNCTLCLACIHYCPSKPINMAKKPKTKEDIQIPI